MEQFSYVRLQRMLHTSHTIARTGFALHADSVRFSARPEWHGDTVALIPFPVNNIPVPSPRVAADIRRAVAFGRGKFHEIAASWAAALPNSIGAKEALAISLEMRGDAAAIDSIRSARSMKAANGVERPLAARQAILLFKFGFPDDLRALREARSLADSTFTRDGAVQAADARSLSAIAALVGDCQRVKQLELAAAEGRTPLIDASRQVVSEWSASEALAALGCPSPVTFDQISAKIWGPDVRGSAAQKRATESQVLARSALLRYPLDSTWVFKLAQTAPGNLLPAARAILSSDFATARMRLALPLESRLPGELTPDVIYPMARLRLMIGDTTEAVKLLDRVLTDVRFLAPGVLDQAVQVGALMRIAVLRSELATARREPEVSRRLIGAVRTLWAGADPAIASTLKALRN